MKGNSGSDTVTMGRGSDGRFMTAALTGEGTVIGDNFVTVDGENRSFTKVSGSEGEYELGINELVTKYGVIPEKYTKISRFKPFPARNLPNSKKYSVQNHHVRHV